MPIYYLDDKHRVGAPFLVHDERCIFRRDEACRLGAFLWAEKAIEAALHRRKNVGRCELCCPWRPYGKKRIRTKLDRLAEKIRRRSRRGR